MADHNTGNLNALLFKGLSKIWGLSYKQWPEEWSQFFDKEMMEDYAEDEILMSGFGLFPASGESSPIEYDKMLQGGMKRYVSVTYKKGYTISKQMIEDNKYKDMVKMAEALKRSWLLTREHVCADYINNGFGTTNVGYDGLALFSASHTNPDQSTYSNLGTAADLTTTSLENELIAISGYASPEGLEMAARAVKLIVPRQLVFIAKQVLQSPGLPTSPNLSINPVQNEMPFVVNHFLTDSDAWFLKTDVPNGLTLKDRIPIEYAMEGDFNTDDQKHKARARFSIGHTDPRGIHGVAGG